VRDPLADLLKARAQAAGGDPNAVADALLGVEAVFGSDLPQAAAFRDEVRAALAALMRDGARATVHRYADGTARAVHKLIESEGIPGRGNL
jgi:fructuronate reductase